MVKTWSEEAEERGLQKGELKGKRELLLDLLETKFPGSSQTARQRVEEWPAEKIKEASRSLLTAQSLRNLGLED